MKKSKTTEQRVTILTGATGATGAIGRFTAMNLAADGDRLILVARDLSANTLINNTALPCFGALIDTDDAQLESVIQTNLVMPMLLTRAFGFFLNPCGAS